MASGGGQREGEALGEMSGILWGNLDANHRVEADYLEEVRK